MTKELQLPSGHVVILDAADYALVAAVKWTAWPDYHSDGSVRTVYVRRWAMVGAGKKHLLLHRFLLGLTDPKIQVDHINGDGLDNRRENLRICTGSQNQGNNRLRRDNTSGVRGVRWSKAANKWMAVIKIHGKQTYLGVFAAKEAAAEAYAKAAKGYFGEFAREKEGKK